MSSSHQTHEELSHDLELIRRANLGDNLTTQQNGDFDTDHAALLQDMARSSVPESHSSMYNYPESGMQLNSYGDTNLAGHSHGLSHGHHDGDLDPATLLQELANFEHTPSSNPPVSNDHFASLLEAAATAGGRDSDVYDQITPKRATRQSKAYEETRSEDTNPASQREKRRRADDAEPNQFLHHGNKRGRTSASALQEQNVFENEATMAREREIWGDDDESPSSSNLEMIYDHPPVGASEARAAGVHSAAALFRKPSSASKKYTRPPMSRLFLSLELSAEDFLHLQAAAKNYMLDPAHPERKDCVGSRGGTDGTMVRLKLFECVRFFMDDLGWGEKCWGASAPNANVRTLVWPKSSNKIISLATPLLRRIVTNERQRLYAIETRGKPGEVKPKSGKRVANDEEDSAAGSTPRNDNEPAFPDIDPKLNQYHYNINGPYKLHEDPKSIAVEEEVLGSDVASRELCYNINIINDYGKRLRPRLSLSPATCPGFSSLVKHIYGLLNEQGTEIETIKVLTADGLVEVGDEERWLEMLGIIGGCDWLDGDVKIVVDLASSG